MSLSCRSNVEEVSCKPPTAIVSQVLTAFPMLKKAEIKEAMITEDHLKH